MNIAKIYSYRISLKTGKRENMTTGEKFGKRSIFPEVYFARILEKTREKRSFFPKRSFVACFAAVA